MKLEFIKDSSELNEFTKTLKWKDSVDFEGDLDDCHAFQSIFLQESTGKYYMVEMYRGGGVYNRADYVSYHRNFKTSEPYVVSFHEVKPVEVVRTVWKDVES